MSTNLIGKKVTIKSNDFAEHEQQASIVIMDTEKNKILLELSMPFENMGTIYSHVIASPRLSCDDFSTLGNNDIVGCSLTWVPGSKYNNQSPVDLSWWRGGAAAIADLYID